MRKQGRPKRQAAEAQVEEKVKVEVEESVVPFFVFSFFIVQASRPKRAG
jgi:hypothetical protein